MLNFKVADLLASRGCGSDLFVYHATYADEADEATPVLRISAARSSKGLRLESWCDDVQDSQSLPPTIRLDSLHRPELHLAGLTLPAHLSCTLQGVLILSGRAYWSRLRRCVELSIHHVMHVDEAEEVSPVRLITDVRGETGLRQGCMAQLRRI